MILRYAWGTCYCDERYPERQRHDGRLILFPKPTSELDKCLRWIKACGGSHDQLNINKINKHKVVCSKHFAGGKGLTDLFPDPIQADGSTIKPGRPKPKRRCESLTTETDSKRRKVLFEDKSVDDDVDRINDKAGGSNTAAVQTEDKWISGTDMFTLEADNHGLRSEIEEKEIKKL